MYHMGVLAMSQQTRQVRKVQVQFQPEVTREQVIGAIDTMFRLSGCLACGLRGIDLTLMGGDPEQQVGQLRGLPGVAAATAI
jgi:hypothetical protein